MAFEPEWNECERQQQKYPGLEGGGEEIALQHARVERGPAGAGVGQARCLNTCCRSRIHINNAWLCCWFCSIFLRPRPAAPAARVQDASWASWGITSLRRLRRQATRHRARRLRCADALGRALVAVDHQAERVACGIDVHPRDPVWLARHQAGRHSYSRAASLRQGQGWPSEAITTTAIGESADRPA